MGNFFVWNWCPLDFAHLTYPIATPVRHWPQLCLPGGRSFPKAYELSEGGSSLFSEHCMRCGQRILSVCGCPEILTTVGLYHNCDLT